jgi:hypothetical protein
MANLRLRFGIEEAKYAEKTHIIDNIRMRKGK